MAGRIELSRGEDLELRRDALAFVLATLPNTSPKVGIHAFEVCQVCGEVGEYQGQAGAMLSHGLARRRNAKRRGGPVLFKAGRHGHGNDPEDLGYRFCEICRQRTSTDKERLVGYSPLCDLCQSAFRRHACREDWSAMIRQFTRERFRYHGLIEAEPAWGYMEYMAVIYKS